MSDSTQGTVTDTIAAFSFSTFIQKVKAFNFGELLKTTLQILTNPTGFFKQMDRSGGIEGPLFYFLLMLIKLHIMIAVAKFLMLTIQAGMFGTGLWWMVKHLLFTILLLPLIGVFIMFLLSALFHWIITSAFGGQGSHEVTARVMCYASAVFPVVGLFYLLMAIIPSIWWLIAIINLLLGLYYCFICVIGWTGVHQTKLNDMLILGGAWAALMVFLPFILRITGASSLIILF